MKNLFYVICFLICSLCNAQTSETNYSVKWLNAESGLNQLSVRNCIMDNDGFLWISTELGLYRYDGNRVLSAYQKNYPSINTKRIFCMVKDYDTNIIYFLTYPDIKFFSISNGNIKQVKNINKIGFFQSLFSFFSTKNLDYKLIQTVLKKNKLFNSEQNILNYSSLNTNSFFYNFDLGYISCIDSRGVETKIIQSNTYNYSFLKFGNIVIGIDKNKLDLFEKNQKKERAINCDKIINSYCYRNNEIYPYDRIFYSSERYFLNFNENIYEILYKGKKLYTKFLFKNPANDIRSLYYSKNDNSFYLCSSTKGLAIVRPKKIEVVTTRNEILDCNYAVVEKNNTWYSYNGWHYNRNSKKFKIKKINDSWGNLRFLLTFKNNNYLQVKNYRFRSIEDGLTLAPLKINKNFDFLTSFTQLENRLWLSSRTNIGYFLGNTMVIDKTLEKKITSPIEISTLSTFKDNLLVGTTKGLYLYNPETKKIASIPKLKNVYARYIKQIDSNSFWVGCYGDGLFLVKNNKTYKVEDKNININTAHAIEEDKNGNVWISTNNGLFTIDKKLLIYKTLNKLPVEFYRFTVEDGLLTNEFNGGSTHPSLKTNDGIIGFPSMKGFVWFDPQKLKKQCFSGNILIDAILQDNKEPATLKDGAFFIKKNTKILQIDFSYAYNFNRDNLTICYRFEDQKKWTEIKGNSFQIGRYKEGNHQLKIRITTHGFKENQGVIKSINLQFETRYYETLWFWSLIGILMIFFIYISYFLGLRLKKKNEIHLNNKIDERTKELRTTVLELESSKITISESLNEKNILLKEIHHRVKNNLQLVMSILNIQALDKGNTSTEEFVEKSRLRINSMVLIHENLYQREEIGNIDILSYLESLTQNLKDSFSELNKNILVQIDVKDIYLDIRTAIPLGLIINEFATNSFKHAFTKNETGYIYISIIKNDTNSYLLNYSDNGNEFLPDNHKKSIGLELVSLLTLQLKGKMIRENIDGTRYIITFKSISLPSESLK